jgi:hypothetical protein
MKSKNYQRRHLRAPLRGSVLYADGDYVLKGTTLNISMGGLLIDQLPNFPESDDVSILLSLPHFPLLKNFSLLKMQTFSSDLFARKVIRAKAKMVRREQLSQNLDNIFRSRFGLEFIRIAGIDEQHIEEYVTNYAYNLVYLQTLIDSFNSDDETKKRARALAHILGYKNVDRIVDLHSAVSQDYKSLQWS